MMPPIKRDILDGKLSFLKNHPDLTEGTLDEFIVDS